MTHYDIDYSNMPPQEKHQKALADIREYMGEERYARITRELRKFPPQTMPAFRLQMSFAGVQGYPVQAFHDEVWPFG